MKSMIWLAGVAALALTACQPADERTVGGHPSTLPPPPPAASAPSLTASGPAMPLDTDDQPELQWAASVVSMDELPAQPNSVKLFGAAGGDPAMNGLQTFIAFYSNPADGWHVFRVGDFLAYRVLGEAPGRVDIEVDESTYDEATGEIGSRTRRMILTWTAAEGAVPGAVAVAEAS